MITLVRRSIFISFLILAVFGFISCENKEQPSKTQVVQVTAILPLTGTGANLGQDEQLGIDLALADMKADDKKVKVRYEDSQSKPDVAVTTMMKALEVDNIKIQIVTTTGPVLATLPAYKNSNKDVLAIVQCTLPGVTKGYPFAFRIYPTSDEETDVLAAYTKEQGLKCIGALYMRNQVGEQAYSLFKTKVESFGGQVPLAENFDLTEKDFRNVLAKFKQEKLDAIFVFAYATTYPIILQQIADSQITLPILGNLSMPLGGIEKLVPMPVLSKVVFPAPKFYFAENTRAKRFNEAVRSKNREPNFDMAYMYDAATMLLKAIATSKSSSPIDVAVALQALSPYEGITGVVRFNEDRDTRADLRICHWTPDGIKALELQQQ